jgi:hypothetical protein
MKQAANQILVLQVKHVGYEAITAICLSTVFWGIMLCGLTNIRKICGGK